MMSYLKDEYYDYCLGEDIVKVWFIVDVLKIFVRWECEKYNVIVGG